MSAGDWYRLDQRVTRSRAATAHLAVPTPPLMGEVRFDIRPWGDGPDPARELLPYLNGVSLVDLVSGFEHAASYDIPGTYAGLVLDHFNVGELTAYLTGQPHFAYGVTRGVIALLGCDC